MAIQPTSNPATARVDIATRTTIPAEAAAAPRPAAEPAQPGARVQQPDAASASTALEDALKSINKAVREQSLSLQFELDTDSGRPLVKIVDLQTKEVLRQIPTEEAVSISKALDKMSGLLIKQQA